MNGTEAWDIAQLDAHGQAALVRDGLLSPGALVEAAILRIEECDPDLNSVSHRAFDHARSAVTRADAAAPLGGVPILLKASLAYPGFPQTSCSRARRDVIATEVFPYVKALHAQGLVAVGMSTMPEFGLLCSGEPMLTGVTRNPWDAGRSAGGSSTGAAVAVAAGLVPLAHASDAGGSIRVPASNCGVVGFKPSRGWNLRARAHHMIDDLLCSDSLIARSVRDVAWGARVTRPSSVPEYAEAHRPLRIAVDLAGMAGWPDAQVERAILSAAAVCVDLGHVVEQVRVPYDRSALRAAFGTLLHLLGRGVVEQVSSLHPRRPIEDLLEPWTIGLADGCVDIGAEAIERCLTSMIDAQRALASFHTEWDVILSPVTRVTPLQVGEMAPTRPFDDVWRTMFDTIDYTPVQNMTGAPSMSLPLGMSDDGLPIGSMFSAAQGNDEILLRLASEIEREAPWDDCWPGGTVSTNAPAGKPGRPGR